MWAGKAFEQPGPPITTTINSMMRRAVEGGDLRGDVSGIDMRRVLAGFSAVFPAKDWPASSRKIL